jgi:chromosome partitioning protein
MFGVKFAPPIQNYYKNKGKIMICLIASQKGGTGKSTITCNVAAALAGLNKDVIMVDADRQITSSEWWYERKLSNPDQPKVHCVQKRGDIDETLVDFNRRYEFVLIDVAGRGESDEMHSALQVCDIVLIPFRPSQIDISTHSYMINAIKNARRTNPKLKAYSLLSIAPTNPGTKEIGLAQEAFAGCPEITLLGSIIYDRLIYRDAMGFGLGVTEMNGKSNSEISSRREILGLIAEVMPDA